MEPSLDITISNQKAQTIERKPMEKDQEQNLGSELEDMTEISLELPASRDRRFKKKSQIFDDKGLLRQFFVDNGTQIFEKDEDDLCQIEAGSIMSGK